MYSPLSPLLCGFVVHRLQRLDCFPPTTRSHPLIWPSLVMSCILPDNPTTATYFSGLNNVWKGCCQDTVFTSPCTRRHTHGYAHWSVWSPCPFSLMSPRHGDNSQHPAFCFFSLHVVKLDVFWEINCLFCPSSSLPTTVLGLLLLIRSKRCSLWTPLFTSLYYFVQETVWICVFDCSKLRPSPWASHVNEIDVSDTTTHTHTQENQWAVVSIYMAFAWISLATREPASNSNKIKKREVVSGSRW